jgi:hypothetical protein
VRDDGYGNLMAAETYVGSIEYATGRIMMLPSRYSTWDYIYTPPLPPL